MQMRVANGGLVTRISRPCGAPLRSSSSSKSRQQQHRRHRAPLLVVSASGEGAG